MGKTVPYSVSLLGPQQSSSSSGQELPHLSPLESPSPLGGIDSVLFSLQWGEPQYACEGLGRHLPASLSVILPSTRVGAWRTCGMNGIVFANTSIQ